MKKFQALLHVVFAVAMAVYVAKDKIAALFVAFGVSCMNVGISIGRLAEKKA